MGRERTKFTVSVMEVSLPHSLFLLAHLLFQTPSPVPCSHSRIFSPTHFSLATTDYVLFQLFFVLFPVRSDQTSNKITHFTRFFSLSIFVHVAFFHCMSFFILFPFSILPPLCFPACLPTPVFLPVCLPSDLSFYPSVCLCFLPFMLVCFRACLPECLRTYLPAHQPVSPPTRASVCLTIRLLAYLFAFHDEPQLKLDNSHSLPAAELI